MLVMQPDCPESPGNAGDAVCVVQRGTLQLVKSWMLLGEIVFCVGGTVLCQQQMS